MAPSMVCSCLSAATHFLNMRHDLHACSSLRSPCMGTHARKLVLSHESRRAEINPSHGADTARAQRNDGITGRSHTCQICCAVLWSTAGNVPCAGGAAAAAFIAAARCAAAACSAATVCCSSSAPRRRATPGPAAAPGTSAAQDQGLKVRDAAPFRHGPLQRGRIARRQPRSRCRGMLQRALLRLQCECLGAQLLLLLRASARERQQV